KMGEEAAERSAGEALLHLDSASAPHAYFTRSQLAQGQVPDTKLGHQYLNSYSTHGGWDVLGIPSPFAVDGSSGTDHTTPYTYHTHVPLAFYGLPFQPGTYRTHAEPIDLAPTLASLLGLNAPTHAVGRVLTEALGTPRSDSGRPVLRSPELPHPSAAPSGFPATAPAV